MVTRLGLVGALRQRLPAVILIGAVRLLAAHHQHRRRSHWHGRRGRVFTGLSSHVWVVLFGIGIAWATVRLRYAVLARALKWLTRAARLRRVRHLSGLTGEVARAALLPSRPSEAMWSTLVAILGTTISPYLFFWQASQEVEVERAQGRRTVQDRQGASPSEIRLRTVDVLAGTFASNLVMFFIILTTAITYAHGSSASRRRGGRRAGTDRRPLASGLYAAATASGLSQLTLLARPSRAGDCFTGNTVWTLAESAPGHGVVALASPAGSRWTFNLNPIRAVRCVVINGVLALFLLAGSGGGDDAGVMARQPASGLIRGVLVTILCMTAAAVGMFLAVARPRGVRQCGARLGGNCTRSCGWRRFISTSRGRHVGTVTQGWVATTLQQDRLPGPPRRYGVSASGLRPQGGQRRCLGSPDALPGKLGGGERRSGKMRERAAELTANGLRSWGLHRTSDQPERARHSFRHRTSAPQPPPGSDRQARHAVIQAIHDFFDQRGFPSTPILTG
jgi:hypothetical protein